MNAEHLKEICTRFDIGTLIQPPTRVYGGLLHLMWRITTNKGSYAIKQLSQNIDLKNRRIRENYELSEFIAFYFQLQGIPAVSAFKVADKHLIDIDGTSFLVYPWVKAKALSQDTISEEHAIRIPTLLAKMHLINLDVPKIVEPEFDTHTTESLLKLVDKAEIFKCPFANSLRGLQGDIIRMNEAYLDAIPVLKTHVVISHGDLDQKNVLWDKNDNPILIDWESARKLNPTYEIVNASLDWSGITTDAFNATLFDKMMNAYTAAGGNLNKELLQAAYYGVLGNWLNWMAFNIDRSCIPEQKDLGIVQVDQVLSTLVRIKRIFLTVS